MDAGLWPQSARPSRPRATGHPLQERHQPHQPLRNLLRLRRARHADRGLRPLQRHRALSRHVRHLRRHGCLRPRGPTVQGMQRYRLPARWGTVQALRRQRPLGRRRHLAVPALRGHGRLYRRLPALRWLRRCDSHLPQVRRLGVAPVLGEGTTHLAWTAMLALPIPTQARSTCSEDARRSICRSIRARLGSQYGGAVRCDHKSTDNARSRDNGGGNQASVAQGDSH